MHAVLRPTDSGCARDLSPREEEVLQHLALGLATREIAARLAISPVTVRNHAQRILSKLGVHSRVEAVVWGFARGVIDLAAARQHIRDR
ncbi:MAG TPA: LuxR C-terminal-related transcriptional regulator [Thermoanaerobaculia bacterium]|nr:LuxR C-terminal-related transcriptional regulator [Thermoanaerobaculia bacterium]